MNSRPVLDAIKTTVRALLPPARIILFGSQARGDYNKHSDYDLLIVMPNGFTDNERLDWSTAVNWAIVRDIHIPVDILLFSEDEITERKEWPGHIVRSAMREGVTL